MTISSTTHSAPSRDKAFRDARPTMLQQSKGIGLRPSPFFGFPTALSIKSTGLGPVLFADSREPSRGSRCYSVLEATKGSIDCVRQFRCALLSSQERPSLQV